MSLAKYSTIPQIVNSTNLLYQSQVYYLANTIVEEMVQNLVNLPAPTIQDLKGFQTSLGNYMNNDLSEANITVYYSCNAVLLPVVNYLQSTQIGFSPLPKQAANESFDGGESYIVTIRSLIGSGPISNLGDTITGAMGNTFMNGTNFLNVTTSPPASFSAALNQYIQALEAAIGTIPLDIKGPLTLNKCSEGNLGEVIYEVPEEPSLAHAWNGLIACSRWVKEIYANNGVYGLTNDGSAIGCTVVDSSIALPICLYYLTGEII